MGIFAIIDFALKKYGRPRINKCAFSMMNEIKLDKLQPYFIASLCIPFTHIYSLDDAKTPFCGEAVQERHTPAYTATGVAEFGIAAGG